MCDFELLHEYARTRSHEAFAELVRRHLGWVHAAALRQVRQRQMAEDVTQAVFVALAQQAGKLCRADRPLSPWLFQVTRYASRTALRSEERRRRHEEGAAAMRSELQATMTQAQWDQLAPLLDDLVARLSKSDRHALLLRFYERKSVADVAQVIGISESAAQKRIERAVERLRRMFQDRGVATAPSAALACGLATYAAQGADASLLAMTTQTAFAAGQGGAIASQLLALAQEAMRLLAWAKVKLVTVIATVALTAAAGTAAGVVASGDRGSVTLGPATAPAATRPLMPDAPQQFSWEDGLEGWIIHRNEDGQSELQSRGISSSDLGATAGRKSLAIDMREGYRLVLRWQNPALATRLKGKHIALDVTAPPDAAQGFVQVAVATIGDGMAYKEATPQDIPMDGRPHVLTFDVSSWPIPDSPEWFTLYIVTNTMANSQPKTIYVDNFRVVDPLETVAAPASTRKVIPDPPPLFSWEDGLEDWQVDGAEEANQARGISTSEVGATSGKRSLAIGIADACLRHSDPALAAQIRGHKVALDVTAPQGTAEDGLQVRLALGADGLNWWDARSQDVPYDGKPHTLVFDLSSTPIPANPDSFDLFIVTNVKDKDRPKTIYIDNLRLVPPLFSWEDGLENWIIHTNEDGQSELQSRGISSSELGATAGRKSLAINMREGYRQVLRWQDPRLATRLKGKHIALDVTAPPDAAQGFVQVNVAMVAQNMPYKVAAFQEVPMDGRPHVLTFDASSWPIPDSPEWFTFFIVTNTMANSQPKTIYVDNLRTIP